MIVFDLKCRRGHTFEAWFNDAASFTRLNKADHVSCAMCGSTKVEKALAAPRISTRKGMAPKSENSKAEKKQPVAEPRLNDAGQYANDPMAAKAADLSRQLAELRGQIEKNCDYVGEQFSEEARRMHYGEAPKRSIYGEATDVDAQALAEEGIEFSRIPWVSRRDS
jgi:hypothetical protein